MHPLVAVLVATLLSGTLSVVVAGLFTFRLDRARVGHLVSYAIGVLLGAAFLDLLPQAIAESGRPDRVLATTLVGLLFFFCLEKASLWRHGHEAASDRPHACHHLPADASALTILIGDGVHNFVDGVLLAAAFTSSFEVGVVTALAVAAHEIPQEIGDFLVLLEAGHPPHRALLLNVISSLSAVVGGVVGWLALDVARGLLPYLLALAAASFVYVAVADMIPRTHRRTELFAATGQVGLVLLGIMTALAGLALPAGPTR